MPLHFQVDVRDNGVILHLLDVDLIDRSVTNMLQDEILAYIENEQPSHVIVSFNNVSRCSTETINILLKALKRLRQYEARLSLCSMRAPIREVFKVLNLDGTVFPIYNTASDAIES
jgi:anti-anti-sigma factor